MDSRKIKNFKKIIMFCYTKCEEQFDGVFAEDVTKILWVTGEVASEVVKCGMLELNDKKYIEEESLLCELLINLLSYDYSEEYTESVKSILHVEIAMKMSIKKLDLEASKVTGPGYAKDITSNVIKNILNGLKKYDLQNVHKALNNKEEGYPKYLYKIENNWVEVSKMFISTLGAQDYEVSYAIKSGKYEHAILHHLNCEENNCPMCDGGISFCVECGEYEGGLTKHCWGGDRKYKEVNWVEKDFLFGYVVDKVVVRDDATMLKYLETLYTAIRNSNIYLKKDVYQDIEDDVYLLCGVYKLNTDNVGKFIEKVSQRVVD